MARIRYPPWAVNGIRLPHARDVIGARSLNARSSDGTPASAAEVRGQGETLPARPPAQRHGRGAVPSHPPPPPPETAFNAVLAA